jgi:toxin ParE1/3/4
MAAFEVLLADDAERDLDDIFMYVAEHDGIINAEKVLTALGNACAKLASFPERGNVPKELQSVGISEYREARFKPYRIIYRVFGRRVIVYCIVDGRRDMQSLLQRRLLR